MDNPPNPPTRRKFLKTSAAASLALPLLAGQSRAAGIPSDQVIKLGLIGCGGRGSGAAAQALTADKNVVLHAIGDVLEDNARRGLANLDGSGLRPEQLKVEDAKIFSGLDAFQKVIDCCDAVILATPPGFRPQHFAAAVDAGKNIFCEKPMAVDAAGARSFIESVKKSKEKNLNVVAGFCWRYADAVKQAVERVHNGEIGDIRSIYSTYYSGPVKPMPAESARDPQWSDVEWQIRNWYNFSWLAGDGLVEQAVHSVDKLCWLMKDATPVSAVANGGRQHVVNGGNIFDHFSVAYEYDNDVICHMATRQIPNCFNENADIVSGTKGTLINGRGSSPRIISDSGRWRYKGETIDMYQAEHDHLWSHVRSGETVNDGDWMIHSTIVALMGRRAAYTGKKVTFEEYLNSDEDLAPDSLAWGDSFNPSPVPVPGA